MPEPASTAKVDHVDPQILHGWWVVASDQLRTAYRWWCEAESDTRADCYATVVAMMDQEAAAAVAYAKAVRYRSPRADGTASVGEHETVVMNL